MESRHKQRESDLQVLLEKTRTTASGEISALRTKYPKEEGGGDRREGREGGERKGRAREGERERGKEKRGRGVER